MKIIKIILLLLAAGIQGSFAQEDIGLIRRKYNIGKT